MAFHSFEDLEIINEASLIHFYRAKLGQAKGRSTKQGSKGNMYVYLKKTVKFSKRKEIIYTFNEFFMSQLPR
jgi:hypothetical protein